MNASPRNETPPALLRREDQGGVATLTLQAPASRNALSLAMIEALIERIRRARRGPVGSRRRPRRRRPGAFGRTRSQGAQGPSQRRRSRPGLLRARHDALRRVDAADRRAAQAGDRGRRGRRDRGGLPARRRLRSRDRRRSRALRPARRLHRPLLFDAAGRGRPRDFAQARDGDGADRRALQRRGGRTLRPRQSRRPRRRGARRSAERSPAASPRARRRRWRSANARSIEQMERPLAEAYALASKAMVDNLAHPDASEGIGAFLDKRDPHWEGA